MIVSRWRQGCVRIYFVIMLASEHLAADMIVSVRPGTPVLYLFTPTVPIRQA